MNINQYFKIITQSLLYVGLGYFIYLMILITWQYVPIDFKAAFLAVKEKEIQLPYYQVAFFSHVYTSIFVLIIGAFQFSNWLRTQHSSIHKNLGKIYIGLILLIASPTGLIMALHANGGTYSKLSFVLQAILWFTFTYLAYQHIRNKNWSKHRDFMIRSFALTLSAISLRLFKWIIVHTWELPPMDTYKIVAWAGWVINLIIAERYIYWLNHKRIVKS
ncbi:MAG: putative membrane protein [Flavobacteriales bacterium]|jgi:uncharacterized membrane protein